MLDVLLSEAQVTLNFLQGALAPSCVIWVEEATFLASRALVDLL